ncbi:recombinase family protein, partial [Salmonella enterica subsp. enterica]|nr:recombinase family protein [Salmonella enterica subsp. enterica]EAB2619305.1 recombinase family protein [Salmonella enterica]EBH9902393.1 recombinase family protein [Salmonella enterica subsp. enterica serovar Typhimurium var. 5-]EBK1370858.1 recombinase family protein [Salmonella enterica subsp. enterica serovar Typhimurium]EBL3577399.1 recombinase family protein [Salmonella enterica subsp. enterica serovar Dublin]EBZ6245737.1 recombinase family protein [Salmonella enterica subsp. enterica
MGCFYPIPVLRFHHLELNETVF